MLIAQQLYEGIDLGPGEPVGLITYMRTDSIRISAEAAQEAIDLIRSTHGNEYAMEAPRFFKNKKKIHDAQDAYLNLIERYPDNRFMPDALYGLSLTALALNDFIGRIPDLLIDLVFIIFIQADLPLFTKIIQRDIANCYW